MSLFTDKSIKNKRFVLSFKKCHGWNVELENPPTCKRRDDISRDNFGMDATPYLEKNFFILWFIIISTIMSIM